MKKQIFTKALFLLLGFTLFYSPQVSAQRLSGSSVNSMVVCDNNTVWVFGRNNNKQLGFGHTNQINEPVENTFLAGATDISAMGQFTLQSNGNLVRWSNIESPTTLGFIKDVKMLGGLEMVLKYDSTVWQVGFTSASKIAGLSDIIAVSNYYYHTLALKSDGTVWAWGRNYNGQVGDGTDSNNRLVPVQVQGLTNVKAIATGGNHSLALKNDGTVWAWGLNSDGQLGDNSNSQRNLPVQVAGGLNNVKAISAGGSHSLALLNDGTVRSWGLNVNGQLGNGNNSPSNVPVSVSGLNNVKEIGSGEEHSLALLTDGYFKAWGLNFFRQLGDGTITSRNTPVDIKNVCPEMQTNLVENLVDAVQFKIYPNPMTEQLTIQSFGAGFSQNELVEFVLTDLQGRNVTTLPLLSSKTVFEKGSISTGIYFYSIKIGNNLADSGKLVIE